MKRNLTKLDSSKGLANKHVLYLMNMKNGRVFPWTPLLAVRKGFVDCTVEGVPVNPDAVKGNDPWIMSQTNGLKDRMWGAGATDATLAEMGRQLTDDATAKFKSLEYKQAQSLRLSDGRERKYLSSELAAAFSGASVRIQNAIEASGKRAMQDIWRRVREAKDVLRIS